MIFHVEFSTGSWLAVGVELVGARGICSFSLSPILAFHLLWVFLEGNALSPSFHVGIFVAQMFRPT